MLASQDIYWESEEYGSKEHCTVKAFSDGLQVVSRIDGRYQGETYRTDYQLYIDKLWRVRSVTVHARRDDKTILKRHLLEDAQGNWTENGEPVMQFKGCIDVDISLTPFTNTLPVKRLNMSIGNSQIITVVYFDIIKGEVRTARQKYTRLSETEYKFENVPNDFEAVIGFDADGLVADYPRLFEQTKAL